MKCVIIGAGPAGLAAGLELLRRGMHNVTIVEQEPIPGGISRTPVYKGNRLDIGGHHFSTKSTEVLDWWAKLMPVQGTGTPPATPKDMDDIILVRNRTTHIFYKEKFFDYPVVFNATTLRNFGLRQSLRVALSYLKTSIFPVSPQKTLEDFMVNRFGRRLFEDFFRDYNYKVWGVPCSQISSDWGAQRIKGLSIINALTQAFSNAFSRSPNAAGGGTFWYPKYGAGQMWEVAARHFQRLGGTILYGTRVVGLNHTIAGASARITGVQLQTSDGNTDRIPCDVCCSTLPVRDLIGWLNCAPADIARVAAGLQYRDFIIIHLQVRQLRANDVPTQFADNWIYIQEGKARVGRIELYNNWSEWLVADPSTQWIGMEYFVNEDDALWSMDDDDFARMAIGELVDLGFARTDEILDRQIIHLPKAYPGYFGTYPEIDKVQRFIDSIPNLYPIGRNGMHRYNNMDHAVLSGIRTAECITTPGSDKSTVWNINAEKKYNG